MSRVSNDTETVALFYESAVAPLIRSVFQVVIIIVIMLLINLKLTLSPIR
jgi:ABC-type multidrug transport system fused ATPase/permease subunit